jgi:hypothetical protein
MGAILPQCGMAPAMRYHPWMRTLAVYLTLLVLLSASLGAGWVASDWPHWCSARHWCSPDWPQRLRGGSHWQ